MASRYEGKTVVVTGAAMGLGRELSLGYAREGAALILIDKDVSGLDETRQLVEAQGAACTRHELDLADELRIAALGAELCAAHPAIHVLYNNAAMAYGPINAMIDDIDMSGWQRFLAVNSLAPLFLAKALRPALAAAKGCVINQSSMAAYMPANGYGVTKSLLNQLTFGMAHIFGKDGIRVCAVAPGIMETKSSLDALLPEQWTRIRAMQMLAVNGMPSDIMHVGLFLGSDEARFITAEVIHCDAGNSLRGWRE